LDARHAYPVHTISRSRLVIGDRQPSPCRGSSSGVPLHRRSRARRSHPELGISHRPGIRPETARCHAHFRHPPLPEPPRARL